MQLKKNPLTIVRANVALLKRFVDVRAESSSSVVDVPIRGPALRSVIELSAIALTPHVACCGVFCTPHSRT